MTVTIPLFLAVVFSGCSNVQPPTTQASNETHEAASTETPAEAPAQDATPMPQSIPNQYPTVAISKEDFAAHTLIYAPALRPELFVACVDNPYFPLIPGTVYHYEEQTADGLETTTVTVTNQLRQVMGISATVVRDTVVLNGHVKEDTWDWYAQDDRSNVWYLGEDTQEYEDGQVVSTAGSWEAGVDGAVPGLMMLGAPRPGDLYYQEYYKGEAEDMGAVISLAEQVSVGYGSFPDALLTADLNPLDAQYEHKFYARGIGVVRTDRRDGVISDLVSINHDSSQMDSERPCLTDVPPVSSSDQEP